MEEEKKVSMTIEQHQAEMTAQSIYYTDVVTSLKNQNAALSEQLAQSYAIGESNRRTAEHFQQQIKEPEQDAPAPVEPVKKK